MKILYVDNLDVGFKEGFLVDDSDQIMYINGEFVPVDGITLIDTPEIREFLTNTQNAYDLIKQIRTTPKSHTHWYVND